MRATVEIPPLPQPPLPVAVSECLTGSAVRYDGSDASASFPHSELNGLLSFVPICPEVGIGMGVPRPPIQLVGDQLAPRVLGVRDPGVDVTDALTAYARARAAQIEGVAGYVFMERSPSCGPYSVPVHDAKGVRPPAATGRGAFARAVLAQHPQLPVEENGRLFDAALRESFLARVSAFAHWRRLRDGGLSRARLMAFHSRYKYLLMAHSVAHYRQAGRLLGDSAGRNRHPDTAALSTDRETGPSNDPGARYLECLMAGLSKPATRGGHANVLSHLQGYLRGRLGSARRRELAELIDAYRRGQAPLAAPRELFLQVLAEHPIPYLVDQAYLHPVYASG